MLPYEKHNVAVEINVKYWDSSKLKQFYAYFVLSFCLLATVSNNWQRSVLGVTYNYPSTDPFYSIKSVITTSGEYGILAGPAFGVTMAIMGLISGYISDCYSRRFVLGFASMCWSATTIVAAHSYTFEMLLFCRLGLGFFQGFFAPCCVGLIVDYFPAAKRTTALGIYSMGSALGAALNSLTTILIG